jgi:putative ABC transport system permease protein
MNAFFGDLAIAVRSLIARPGFSLLTIGVLGAGLACVIFMLAILNGFIFRPPPFAAPEQLVQAGIFADGDGSDYLAPLPGNELMAVRRQLGDLAQVEGFARSTMNLSDMQIPERDYGAFVSAKLFAMLGVAPILGRDFVNDDQIDGAPAVAMLSYDLWHSRYGADPAIVGRQIRINSQPAIVIGVMPQGFSFPTKEAVWMAAHLFNGMKPDDYAYWIIARRNANVTDAAIATELDTWFAQAVRADPQHYRGMHAGIGPLENLNLGKTLHKPLYIMLAAVFMLLLVACANAGNLMLARMLGRRQEIVVRVALGATRRRLVTYLLMESLLLSLVAAAAALLVADAGLNWVIAWFRANDFGPPHWQRFDIDGVVLIWAVCTGLLAAFATGFPAAWSASNETATNNLRADSQRIAGGSLARTSRILVICEVALSCALLVSVGMMVRNIVLLNETNVGINTDRLFMSRVVLPTSAYPTAADQLRVFERMTDRLRAESEVAHVTIGTAVPGTYWNEDHAVAAAGETPGGGALAQTETGGVDNDFLATFGVVLQEGRFFDARDGIDSPRVAVVDRRFVDRFSPNAPILGRQFRLDPRDAHGATVTVIGVVNALMLTPQEQQPEATLLMPLSQAPYRLASLTVRTRENSPGLALKLNKMLREVDADLPLNFRGYDAVLIDGQSKTMRTIRGWFNVLGIVALVLSGAGLYGVMSVSVGRRIREIGVRRALGAPNGKVLRALFSRSIVELFMGLALGLAVGIPFAKVLDGSLYMATGGSSNLTVILSAVGVMILAALAAMIVPARRALRVDPIHALRYE